MKKKKILLGLGSFAILGLATVLASCDGEKTYTVTFYNGTTEVTTQTVTGGYNAEVPTAPTKEGSKFNGWYADEALTTAFDFGSIIEGDTAVYAGWVNESAVVFKDGSTTLSTQTVLNGSNAKVPTAPTATGKRFNGWYKDAACTQAFDFGSVITTSTTVYAGWVDQYTVTFKDGGRTLSAVTVEDGNLVDVPTAPTKDNKVFAGWFTDQTYATAYDFGSPVTSSKSVYAKWDSVYYTVSLYIDANTKWKDIQVESEEVLPTDLAPTRNYSVWDGKWYTDAACTQQFVTSTAITGATTLYAGWNVETENVTYSFDYAPLIAAYSVGNKTSTIVNSGIFYLDSGMYFENKYANQTDSSKANDPDFNNQKKAFWWTLKTGGKLSFDWKDRGSTTKFTIYRIPAVSTNSEVPTYSDDDVVYNKTTSTLTSHFEYDCAEAGTYIFVADGNIMVQQLQCSDVVEKSAPVSISVAGARNQFLVGAEPASTGLSCTLNYANGSTESVSAASTATDDKTGFVVDYSEVNFNEEGTYTVNVTYTAHDTYGDYPFTTSYDINVYAVDSIEAFTFGLDSSRNTQHNQLVYAVGDTVKTDKVYVHAYGEIGESAYDEQLTNEFTFNTVDTSTTGKKTVTATYTKDTTKTSSFDIQVVEKVFNKESAFATVYVDASLEDKVAKKVAFNEYTYSEYTEGAEASYVFASVTEALQYLQLCEVSDDATKVLVLADGVYNEKVFVDMPNVTILGSTSSSTNNGSNSGAVITFNAMNGITAPNGASYSTDGAASFTISKNATNCLVSNVTLSNYYNTHERYVESQKITSSTQATSVLVRGDMARFYNVSFSGYHDTLYADQGRQYYNNCYIEGRTDYIFGSDATAYFTNCTIKTLGAGLTEKNGGYVVATKGTSGLKYGYVFNNCTFTADDETQAGCVSIARGWEANMTIMVMNCNIDNHFSKGTYGQGYYEVEDCTAEKYEAAFATGIYTRSTTYNEFKPSFTAVASTAKFNAEETYFVKNGDAYVKEVVTADTFAAAVEAGLYTVKFDSTKTYFAKNGEEYVEQYLTKDTFIAALETGLYTATDTYTKEKQSADGEYQFDASKTYYVQLNDRYTKMNADPVASLLFEYNNNGEGAIDYDANLANRYARKTFTLLNPASTDDQAIAAKYADLNEVFAGSNYNWNPVGQGYSLTIYDDTTTIASYSKYVYVGNTLTATQVKEINALVEANLNAETQVLVGLYTDSSFTTELSKGLEITTETKIYAKIKKAKVTVTQELFETGTLTESIADGSTVVDNNYFTVKSVKIVASVATGYSPAVTEDEKHTFAKGLLPTGGTKYSDGKYYEITAKEDGQITIYYLSTDSGYTTKNQSKNDKLVTKAGDAEAVTAEQIAYDNKVAYTYTFNVTKGTVYRVSSTSNRLVLLGVEYYNRTVEFEEEETAAVAKDSYSITFGANGSYKTTNPNVTLPASGISDHGSEATSQVNGDIKLNVKAGGVVVVYGYPGFYAYSIKVGNAEAVPATKECAYAKVTTDSEVVISSTKYLYEIDVVYPLDKDADFVYGDNSLATGDGLAFQYVKSKTINDHGDSYNFKNDTYTYAVFTVAKNGTVEIGGLSATYCSMDIYKNFEKLEVTATEGVYTIEVAAGDVIAITGDASDQSNSYFKTISYKASTEQAPVVTTVSLNLDDLTTPVEKGTAQGIFTIYGKDVASTDTANLASRNVNVKSNDYGKYLELSGGGSAAYKSSEKEAMPANCVGVTCSGAGTIKVTLQNKRASTHDDYKNKACLAVLLQRVDNNGTLSQTKESSEDKMPASDEAPVEFTFEVTKAGTYYVGFSDNGGYIYAVSFTAK